MSRKLNKAAMFRRLLPKIYFKLIVEDLGHTECAIWLKEVHNLDFFPDGDTSQYPNTFYFYLSKYGDLKKAREDYEKAFDGNTKNWWSQLPEDERQEITIDKSQSHVETTKPMAKPLNTEDGTYVPLTEKLGVPPLKNQNKDFDPLEGYRPNDFNR